MATSFPDDRRRQSLIDQIPTENRTGPAAGIPANSGIHGSELGRQAFNTAMALPGAGGIARLASTGGAISKGVNLATGGVNRLAQLGAGATATAAAAGQEQPAPQAATPSTSPNLAPSDAGAGRGQINPPAANPNAPRPISQLAAMQPPEGSIRFDPSTNTYSGTNVGADAQIIGGRNGGGAISGQNEQAAEQLATGQNLASRARVAQDAQMQPSTRGNLASRVTATHSGNDFTAREALRRAKMDAGSLIHKSSWAPKGSGQRAQQAYGAALQGDLAAMTKGQADADVSVMQQNAGITREGMQQDGANFRTGVQEAGADRRDGRRSLGELARLDMERETQGFTNRAAAQQEQLRNSLLDPNATPQQRALAQRSLAALSGKTAADRMQTVTLPDTTNDMGQVVRGGQALVRVMEDGTVQQVPVGAMTAPQPAAQQGRYAVGTRSTVNGKTAQWDGSRWVPQ